MVLAQVAGLMAVLNGGASASSPMTFASTSDVAGQSGVTWTLTFQGWSGSNPYSSNTDIAEVWDSLGVVWPTSAAAVSASFSGAACSVAVEGVGPGPVTGWLRIPLGVSCSGGLTAGTLTLRISGITNPAATGPDVVSYEDAFMGGPFTAGTLLLVSQGQPSYVALTPDPATGGASATWSIALGAGAAEAAASGTPSIVVTEQDAVLFPTSPAAYTLTVAGTTYAATQVTASYGVASVEFTPGVLPLPPATGAVLAIGPLTNPPAGDSDSVTVSMSGYAATTSPAVAFVAASGSGLSVALSDARAGATSTWSLDSIPGWPNDGLYEGWTQIALQDGNVASFPTNPADYSFTYNGAEVMTATSAVSGGPGLMTVNTQCAGIGCSTIGAPPSVAIQVKGVVNGGAGPDTVKVTASAVGLDPNNRTSATATSSTFPITSATTICCATVTQASIVMATRTTWNLAFTTGLQTTASGTGLAIADADGAVFPSSASDYHLTVAGATYAAQSVATTAGHATMTFAAGVLPPPVNTPVDLSVDGVINPTLNGDGSAGSDTVTVTTAGYTAAASAPFGLVPYTRITNVMESMSSALPGGPATWTTSFTTGNGALVGGDTITVEEVGISSTFPSSAGDYTVTPAGGTAITPASVTAYPAQGPGRYAQFTLTLPDGASVAPGTAVTVTANDVQNPASIAPGAANVVYADTSAAPALQESAPFGPLTLTNVTAATSSTVAGVTGVTWTVGFTNSAIPIGAGSQVTLSDGLGAAFAATTAAWGVSVGGGALVAPTAVSVVPDQATLTLPAGVPGGASVVIQALNTTNPATSGSADAVSVATGVDAPAATNSFLFSARGGQYDFTPAFSFSSSIGSVGSGAAGSPTATWTVSFTSPAALTAGTDTISITAPGQAQFPTSASGYTFSDHSSGGAVEPISAVTVSTTGPNGVEAQAAITVPQNVAAGDDLVVTIAGVVNPTALIPYPGSYFSVASTQAPTPVGMSSPVTFSLPSSSTGLPALAALPIYSSKTGDTATFTASGTGPCSNNGGSTVSDSATINNVSGPVLDTNESVARCALTAPQVGTASFTAPSANVSIPVSCSFTYSATSASTHTNTMWVWHDWLTNSNSGSDPGVGYEAPFEDYNGGADLDQDSGQVSGGQAEDENSSGQDFSGELEPGADLNTYGTYTASLATPHDSTVAQAQNFYDGNFLHCEYQLVGSDGSVLSDVVLNTTTANTNTATGALTASLPAITGTYQLKYDVWVGQTAAALPSGSAVTGQTALSDGPQGCGWAENVSEAWYQAKPQQSYTQWALDHWQQQTPYGQLGAVQCGINPGFQQAGPTSQPSDYATYWNSQNTNGYNVGNGLSGLITAGTDNSAVRQAGTQLLTINVEPTALLQLDVMPYRIIYQPPGDRSQASFSLQQGATSFTQFSLGQSGAQATVASVSSSTSSTSTQNNAGFLSSLGVVDDVQTTTNSSWDQSTAQTTATASTSSNSIDWTDSFTQTWQTAPNVTQLRNPNVPPWYYDEFALSVHPQLAVWDFGATSGAPRYALLSTDTTEVDVTAQELLQCSQNGAPLPLPGVTPAVVLQPAECASLLALDPFAAAGSQAANPGQTLGPMATRIQSISRGSPGLGTDGPVTYTLASSETLTQQTSESSSFTSAVTAVVANSQAVTASSGFNSSALSSLIPTNLGGIEGKVAAVLVKAGLGALGNVSTGPTTTTGSGSSTGFTVQVNYGQSDLSSTYIATSASASLDDGTNPVEATVWVDSRWDTLMFQVPAPDVSAISPTSGPTAGGTTVTVRGTGFWSGPVAVDFCATNGSACTPGTGTVAVTDTSATVVSPPLGAGTVDVRVQGVGGLSPAVTADQFTFAGAGQVAGPVVTGLSPSGGPTGGGTAVTIAGTGLAQVTQVWFGTADPSQDPALGPQQGVAEASSFRVVSDQQIVACAPPLPSPGTVYVSVYGNGGWSQTVPGSQYIYSSGAAQADQGCSPAGGPPVVTSVSPAVGPAAGGALVTIQGIGFADVPQAVACNGVGCPAGEVATLLVPPQVEFCPSGGSGCAEATDVQVAAGTITALAPPGTGAVNVLVRGAAGFSVPSDTDVFTYASPTSQPSTVSPGPASIALGASPGVAAAGIGSATLLATVLDTLDDPVPGTQVQFSTTLGQVTVTQSVYANGLGVSTATLSSAVPGTATVTAAVYGSPLILTTTSVTFLAVPQVTGLSESSGTAGDTVTVSGSGFTGASAVYFGGSPATDLTVADDGRLTARVPAGAGTVDVRVANAAVESPTVAADRFAYPAAPATAVAPNLTSLSQAVGPVSGGNLLTILGSGFAGATSVAFGGVVVSSFTIDSAGSIAVTVPAGAPGPVEVTVAGPGGVSAALPFTYLPLPTVTGLDPAGGPDGGDISVAIGGTGFTPASSVAFGGEQAQGVDFVSSSELLATAPAGAGTVDVTVTTPCAAGEAACGTSLAVLADRFTYAGAPVVTALNPVNGPVAGGTQVTITGSGLAGATSVHFGTLPASYAVESDGTILATSPAGTPGTVDITVTGPDGTSALTSADRFTFGTPPAVTGISPDAGQAGSTVTISGSGFTTVTAVDFGTAAASIASHSDSQIAVVVPSGTGTVDVTVTTACGTPGTTAATSCGISPTAAADQFSYSPLPTVAGLSPSSGPAAGGTSVTISGSGFTTASAVDFGTAAASFTVVSDDAIHATVPAGSGTVDVTVTTSCASATATSCGTSATTAADQYTYVSPAQTVVRILKPGWNTLSIPFDLAQDTVGATFSDGGASILAAYTYTDGRWQPALARGFSFVPLRNATLPAPMTGLFIYIGGTASVTVTLAPAAAPSGTTPSSPPATYVLTQGWNLVGPSSGNLSEPVSVFVQGADIPAYEDPNTGALPVADPGTDTLDQVRDGYAYWVYAGDNNQVLTSQIVPVP